MIPLSLYTPIYYFLLLVVVLITAYALTQRKKGALEVSQTLGLPFLLLLVLYMGLRPLSSFYFGDMGNYSRMFTAMQTDGVLPVVGEVGWLFSLYMFICGLFIGTKGWFLLTAVLYCGLAAFAFKLIHGRMAYLAFLMCVASFSFWAYGTNGLRNGLACSLVLLGIACSERKWLMGLLFLLAFSTHPSTALPIAAFVLTTFYNKPRYYLIGYGAAIILSISMGEFWVTFIANLGIFEDGRLSQYLLSDEYADQFSSAGFRYDFLLYSLCPIVSGAYYIFEKNYRDPFYLQLFNTYVVANALWVLVIQASFSNRFAYLSWFMMSWVIIYPLLKHRLFKKQNLVLAVTIVSYYAVTYFLFFVL